MLFKDKYRSKSIRITTWDYRWNGVYFVTICSRNKECCFGNVRDNSVELSDAGKIAEECWLQISEHFKFVKLGPFIVMPNHIHGIIIIQNIINHFVETLHATSLQSEDKDKNMSSISPQSGSLSTIVRSYKSAVSMKVHSKQPGFGWQSRFYEHIIREEKDYCDISKYIEENPIKWSQDRYFQ